MSERTPEELALGWRDALLERDAAAFAMLFAHDGVMIDVEHRTPDLSEARPLRGRATIESVARAWLEQTPKFEFEVLSLVSTRASAAVHWRYRVPVAAGELSLDGVTWLNSRDGEICEAFVYFDSFRLLRALGRV